MCAPHPYPFICWWTLGLLPCLGYCTLCRYGQWGVCNFLNYGFLQIYSEGQLMDHMIGSIPSFFLELFLHWSPVAYWAPTDLGISTFSVLSFCLFILFMRFSGKNTEVVFHSILQWTTLCQTSPPWPICLGGPTRHGLVSLS